MTPRAYTLDFRPRARADLLRLDPSVAQRVLDGLRRLAENFESLPHEALTGEWSGAFRERIGDYRVIYTYNQTEREIAVLRIGHRREIYRAR